MPGNLLLYVFIALSVSSPSALCAEDDGKVHVLQMDRDLPVDELARPGVQVHKIGENLPSDKTFDPKLRDEVFKKAGMSAEVTGLEQFERDLLFQRTLAHPVAKLVKLYPKISAQTFERLKKAQRETK